MGHLVAVIWTVGENGNRVADTTICAGEVRGANWGLVPHGFLNITFSIIKRNARDIVYKDTQHIHTVKK